MREVAYAHIQKKIASRVLRAGTPVSELPIANELGISRTPTREAMRQLVAEGLLEEIPGRGVVVVTLEKQDIVEIYELREALESRAVHKVAQRSLSPTESQNLRAVANAMGSIIEELERSGEQVLNSEQMNRLDAADLGFHIYVLQIAGNRRALKLVNDLRSLIRIFAKRRRGHAMADLKRIHKDHCDIIGAIESGDAATAVAVLSAHIQAGRQERLEQFDQREREASLPQDIAAFIEKIQSELV